MKWRTAVLGSPIAHSLSPQLQDEARRLLGIDGESERYEITAQDASKVTNLFPERFDAASVTMPLKGLVGTQCATLDEAARRTNSVNSLLFRDGSLHGISTDGEGFINALRGESSFEVTGRSVLVLGAGGSARAICDALVAHGASSIAVLGRSEGNVAQLVATDEKISIASTSPNGFDLVVNTIPHASRTPESDQYGATSGASIGVDVVYEPRFSAWRMTMEQAGTATVNGAAMLAYQAALQFKWWWGEELDGHQLLGVLHD